MVVRICRAVLFLSWCAAGLVVPCVGCAVGPPPPPPEPIAISVKKPVFTALKSDERQSKGGITVSVAPVAYEVKPKVVRTEPQVVNAGVRREYAIGSNAVRETPVQTLQRTVSQTATTEPEELAFTVTVNNQLSRVFHGQGIVVQFNVNNKLQSVNQAGYEPLQQMIVPPRNEAQVTIRGPLLSTIPDGANIGLFLYDVVTKTDAAGNVTEKQNFEWYYKYSTTAVEQLVQPPKVETEERVVGPAQIRRQ